MANILVTGAAGFIGSHLCAYLLKRGDRVIGIDNLWTGSLDNVEVQKFLINQLSPEKSSPPEVLYSWKPQDTDPKLHPSRLVSSVPVNRISANGSVIRN